ncbi:tetratricopeptide repeat protein [Marivibrio halodurans]|uniref:Tetratricopeptide repeat protein n=1 Tax=Marivibrio halodurans TaxID=2039722 RepID=A0A8J7UZT9_9PROT|nr:tetratricopeptide repeat protein [Marivibrio halodurans]
MKRLIAEAMAAYGAGDARKAEAGLRQAARLKPFFPPAAYNLAVLLRREGRAADAVRALETVVERAPDYLAAWIELALARQETRATAGARAAADRALALAPSDGDARRAAAGAAFADGDWRAAADHSAALAAPGPEDRLLHARALLECGEKQAAQEELHALATSEPARIPDILKVLTHRGSGGFPLDERRLMAALGLDTQSAERPPTR